MGIIKLLKNSNGNFKIETACNVSDEEQVYDNGWQVVQVYPQIVEACKIGKKIKRQLIELQINTEESGKSVV